MNFWDPQSTLQYIWGLVWVLWYLFSQITMKFEETFNLLNSNLMKSNNLCKNLPVHGGWSCWPWTRLERAGEPVTSCCFSDHPQGGNPGPSLLSSSHTWQNTSHKSNTTYKRSAVIICLNKSCFYCDRICLKIRAFIKTFLLSIEKEKDRKLQ